MREFLVDTIEGDNKQVLALSAGGDVFQLDMMHDSTGYLDRWYSGLINNAIKNVYIFYGCGNGMYVKRVLQDAKPDDMIVVYEPDDQIISKAKELFDLSGVLSDKRLQLFVGDYIEFRTYVTKNTDYSMQDTMNLFVYPNYENIYESDYAQFLEVISDFQSRFDMVIKTDFNRAEMRFRNSIANIGSIKNCKSFVDMTGRIEKDIPVFIVASGPSLDKNINELKRAKGKGIIVCVDSAIPALLKRDIIPDMYFSVDVVKKKDHFTDERVQKIPAVGINESVPFAFSDTKSNYIIIDDMVDFFTSEGCELLEFDPEGSVANAAFEAFLSAGFNNIILVGQDLAFTDNREHSFDVINDVPDDFEGSTYVYVDGVTEEKVRTSMQFRLYINEFEKHVKLHPDANIIDATEGGALIHGTKIMKLSEAIDTYCTKDFDFAAVDASVSDLLDDEQKIRYIEYIRQFDDLFNSLKLDLERVDNVYRSIITEIKRTYNVNKIKRFYAQSEMIMERVRTNPILKYAENMNAEEARDIQKRLNVVQSPGGDELLDSINIALTFNESLLKSANTAREIFREYEDIWNND